MSETLRPYSKWGFICFKLHPKLGWSPCWEEFKSVETSTLLWVCFLIVISWPFHFMVGSQNFGWSCVDYVIHRFWFSKSIKLSRVIYWEVKLYYFKAIFTGPFFMWSGSKGPILWEHKQSIEHSFEVSRPNTTLVHTWWSSIILDDHPEFLISFSYKWCFGFPRVSNYLELFIGSLSCVISS